jgi:hypothetical protein
MPISPADTFRGFVSGDPIRIEEKHQVPITVRNPLRLIFTTNNDDIIRTLSGGRDLTEYDRDAIAQRIYHLDINEDCPRWLISMGGMAHTKGWIRGDSGEASGRVVAGHFMWLYQNRPKALGKRFLMDGCNNERIIKAMTLRSGGAPAVFEIIARQIENAGKNLKWAALVENGKVFVTEAQIEEYDREFNKGRKPLSLHVIRTVLAAMRAKGSKVEASVKGGPMLSQRKLAVWHELNLQLILDEAIERGLPCARLQSIAGLDTLSAPEKPKEAVK